MNVSRGMPHPVEMARAFALPFVYMIGGFAALLAILYLVIGEDPTVPVGLYLVDSADATLPLAGRLTVIWSIYSVLYLLISAYRKDPWVGEHLVEWFTDPSRGLRFFLCMAGVSAPTVLSPVFKSLSLLVRWPLTHLSVGWAPGFSPQIK